MQLIVPYFPQAKPYSCAAATVRMMLGFFGMDTEEDTLEKELGTTAERGVPNGHIVQFLIKKGLFCYVNRDGTIEEIRQFIERGLPVMVNFIEPSMNTGHFALVVGIDEASIILHDPWNGEHFTLLISDFEKSWIGGIDKIPRWLLVASREDLHLGKQFLPDIDASAQIAD